MPAKWLLGREMTPPQSLFYLIITRLGDFGRQGPMSKLRGREGSCQSFLWGFCKISGPAGSWGVELGFLKKVPGSSGRGLCPMSKRETEAQRDQWHEFLPDGVGTQPPWS